MPTTHPRFPESYQPDVPPNEPTPQDLTLADYLAVVRRYKWVIIVTAIVVPLVAFAVSSQKAKQFAASAQVLLNYDSQNLGAAVTGVPAPGGSSDPERYSRTQAALARVPEVARRALASANVDLEPWQLLERSSVRAGDTDLLDFRVVGTDPAEVTRLATAYADAFTRYRLEQDTASLAAARREIQGRLAEIRRQGGTGSQAYLDLQQKAQDLRTLELLQARPEVVRPAIGAPQIAPKPKRDAMLGAILGVLLGLGLAFAWNALDKRVRSTEEVEHALGLPLLAKLPAPRRGSGRPEMLVLPNGPQAEAIRRLRTSLELTNIDISARSIMVTSPGPSQGKSTTIANLGVALARSGKSVVLIDLDLRQPSIATFFGLEGRPGLTDVAVQRFPLQSALATIRIPGSGPRSGEPTAQGQLDVIPSGPLPPSPGEWVGTPRIADLIKHLENGYDYVLVDAPPMLAVDDAMTLSTRVDAIIAVVMMSKTHRNALREFGRALRVSPAIKLGYVLTDVDLGEQYGYASYGYGSEDGGKREELPAEPEPAPIRTVRLKPSGR